MIKVNSLERKNNSALDIDKLIDEESKIVDEETACTSD